MRKKAGSASPPLTQSSALIPDGPSGQLNPKKEKRKRDGKKREKSKERVAPYSLAPQGKPPEQPGIFQAVPITSGKNREVPGYGYPVFVERLENTIGLAY